MTLPKLHIRGRIADQIAGEGKKSAAPSVSPMMIEDVLYSEGEMGGNYQIYTSDEGLRIDAERLPGSDGQAARGRIIAELAQRGVAAKLDWVEHIPRTGGKTRRIRPLDQRDQLMRQESMI